MDIVNLIISLVSGAVGGNVAGAAVSEKNLGPVVNTIAGLIGGAGGEFLLRALGILSAVAAAPEAGSQGIDIGALLANIGISGVSGGALTAIISLVKAALEKK